ncbi:conserved hypothetical protein [Pyrobaculum islandicum DSM 4184]|uniref:Uncharacterized protein n=1 Tax=Pyrobaculum islandicum (strain DSM 4184 / JCM 9189 / GEO3) TaxID=384616 RepID=A1RTP6_PYRIL|nr:hypothetical protein [Pyrobaculum islandicum]ABL88328.1 conserved hypothetical protein [Pyrobaculum islandicum DSM 4184]
MESIDMLIAFGLVAAFMLGVYLLSYYFTDVTKQTELQAASKLDAQEILKKIVSSPGSPPGWTDINSVQSLGLADPQLPGQLDSRKLLALAEVSGVTAEANCTINTAGQDYPVTKVGYGVYLWGVPTPQSVDPAVYERILRSLFGDQWNKYDIEIVAKPALNISIMLQSSQVFINIKPPGVYSYDVCYVYWGAGSPVLQQQGLQIIGAYVWSETSQTGKDVKTTWYLRIDVLNTYPYDVNIVGISLGNEFSDRLNKVVRSYCSDSFKYTLPGAPSCLPSCTVTVAYTLNGVTITTSAPVVNTQPSTFNPSCIKLESAVAPQIDCTSGVTDENGYGVASVAGVPKFAWVNARGVMMKSVNYTYGGVGTVSLVGLVARPDAGVYLIHSKLIQNAGRGASLCGCYDPGVSALGLRGLWTYLGGQTVPLLNNVVLNPASSINLADLCQSGDKDRGGCLIPWQWLGRAKFLIAAVERNSNGDPPKCGGIPQEDVIVMPLTGGLPPLYEIRFATWRRWAERRPEALAVSYASALADAGEVTYKVDLWVFRYP